MGQKSCEIELWRLLPLQLGRAEESVLSTHSGSPVSHVGSLSSLLLCLFCWKASAFVKPTWL